MNLAEQLAAFRRWFGPIAATRTQMSDVALTSIHFAMKRALRLLDEEERRRRGVMTDDEPEPEPPAWLKNIQEDRRHE
jgi:hypothetical protein